MNKHAVICAIEHVLRNEGCNEVLIAGVFERVKKTRGNLNLGMDEFMSVLRELEKEGLFEWFGDTPGLTEDSLIARSQNHPSVPLGDAIRL
jgi:hypothetical protein